MDEVKYRLLVENSSDSFWAIDENYKLTSFNNSFFESSKLFYGVSPFIGMSVMDFLNSNNKTNWLPLYNRVLKGEFFSEEIIEHTLGLQLCFDVSFNPITVNSVICGAAIFSKDITARKNIEQQLEYKVNELNTFVYKATHDLRSPLVSVIGLVQLVKQETALSEIQNYIDMIGQSVQKMDHLLIDLVKIVNVSQGQLAKDKIDFVWIVDEVLDSLAFRPEFSKIIFRKHYNVDIDYYGDSGLMNSILQNIIDNAIKYKKKEDEPEPMIIIAIDVDASQVKIGITDNGIGIQEGLVEKVFDMFYRATSASDGTGLGLYIVKTAVEKMGGKINLSSVYDKGTSVSIVIPNFSSI